MADMALKAPEKNFELSMINGASNKYVAHRLKFNDVCKCLTIVGNTGIWVYSSICPGQSKIKYSSL